MVALALVAGVVLVWPDGGGGHLAANRRQLRTACRGTLPYRELAPLVRDGRPGRLSQYGTMLDPGQQSRSLLDCSLSWGGGYGVAVHAEALVSDVPQPVTTEQLLRSTTDANTFVAPGITGEDTGHGAWVVTECRNGLKGRVRPSTDLYVTAQLGRGNARPGVDGRQPAALAEFRTAVHVANAVAAAQHCGGHPVDTPTGAVTGHGTSPQGDLEDDQAADLEHPASDLRKCRWIGPASLPGLKSGSWSTEGDLQQSPVLSACAGHWDPGAHANQGEAPANWQVTGVEAASWAGVVGRSAYHAYQREGHVPTWADDGTPSIASSRHDDTGHGGQPDTVSPYADTPQLALWAQSVCGGRTTYHRVSVLPHLRVAQDTSPVVTSGERASLDHLAHRVMSRYLHAAGGWPDTVGCHDTRLLGEVEEWH